VTAPEVERCIHTGLARFRHDRDYEDLCQEARVAVWQKLAPPLSPGLVATVSFRAAVDCLRVRDGKVTNPHPQFISLWQGHGDHGSAGSGDDPGCAWLEQLEAGRTPDFSGPLIETLWARSLFAAAARQGKGKPAAALLTHFRDGDTLAEMAVRLGVSHSRAYQLLQQGLNRLRAQLGLPERGMGPARWRARWVRIREQPAHRARRREYARAYYERNRAKVLQQQRDHAAAGRAARPKSG